MKIIALSSFAHKAEHIEAGSEIDVSDTDGIFLIATGRARRAPENRVAVEAAQYVATVERADVSTPKKKK